MTTVDNNQKQINRETPQLWRMTDVQTYLGCSRVTVWHEMKSGLPHIKRGRNVLFSPDSVQDYYKSKEIRGGNNS